MPLSQFLSKIKPVLYPQLRNFTNHLTLVNVSSLKMPSFVLSHSHESFLLRPKGVFKVGTKISQYLNLYWKYILHLLKEIFKSEKAAHDMVLPIPNFEFAECFTKAVF